MADIRVPSWDAGTAGRLLAAVTADPGAPEVPLEPVTLAFPADGLCPDCGTPLCRWCARVYKLTRQHLRPDGRCPFGHRAQVKETTEGTVPGGE